MNNMKKADGFKGEKIVVLPGEFIESFCAHPLIRPLYPTDVGYFPDALHHYRKRDRNSCPQYILIFCAKGKGFLTLDGKQRAAEKNTLFIIPKGKAHCYGSDEKEPWSIYWVHFTGQNAARFLEKYNFDNSMLHISLEKAAVIQLLFDEMIEVIEKGYTYDNMVYVSQLLSHLLGLVFFSMEPFSHFEEKNVPIEESISFMNKNLGRNFSLKQFARNVNLSATHFSFLFKKKTGFSPIDYFIRLKIQRACQYLDLTDFKINEIAKELGFSDPYYFSRVFYRVMHHSPKDYRAIKKG